jgi:3-deoxy-D-manno-octulosonic-acid transferase
VLLYASEDNNFNNKMLVLYDLGVRLYFFVIYLAALFNEKARLWVTGRQHQGVKNCNSSIWFHFASLGEFEQGRPVLEQMRNLYPEKEIIITFFSPSGYEIRKNTPLAKHVYYLPLDTAKNARVFISTINPEMAIFTKYEYWYHFYKELKDREVPLYIISGIFRPGQIFFKWYGGLHRKILSFVSHFFVQDERSQQLLQHINIKNVTLSGDTRFDRVWANSQQPKPLPVIDKFKSGQKIFIAGSTWPQDEQLLPTLINSYPNWKFIIAPHEVGEEKINNLTNLLSANSTVRYSQLGIDSTTINAQTLIIDNIGMLSSLYQYGDIAYIGGGFGAGIHNTLEAAAFGLPVIFGPNYSKFKEARDLINLNAGFTINDETGLEQITGKLINDFSFYATAHDVIKKYVAQHTGATNTILDFIKANHQ